MQSGKLRIRQTLPEGFLTCSATELYRYVPEPTLFHLDGRNQFSDRLFISILLHGDETAGLHAIQALLKDQSFSPKRPISLFVGNVAAAREGVRRLKGQTDFNRCWPGGLFKDTPEGDLMRELVEEMSRHTLFASIDIHNNTGKNPHYGCINRLDAPYVYLASLFSQEIVYFLRPKGVQSMAFANLCPAVTLECGSIGDLSGVTHAEQYIRKIADLDSLLPRQPYAENTRVYHTMAQIRMPDGISYSFDGTAADIMFLDGFETWNFHHLQVGKVFAKLSCDNGCGLAVIDENGIDKTEHFIENRKGQLLLKQPVIPAMLTTSRNAIRQDCLGYLMELLDI